MMGAMLYSSFCICIREKGFLSTISIVLSCIVDFSDCNAYNKINFNFERKEGNWFGMAGGFDLCRSLIHI